VTVQFHDTAAQKPLTPTTVWYDGENDACVLEIAQLTSKDKHGRLQYVNVSAQGFQADGEVTAEAVRREVHARHADGRLAKGIAALEAAYDAIGLGSWFRFCRKPGLESGLLFSEPAETLKMAA
jgi:predicted DCC family thiol-disulfide oxidoreductase YuxK